MAKWNRVLFTLALSTVSGFSTEAVLTKQSQFYLSCSVLFYATLILKCCCLFWFFSQVGNLYLAFIIIISWCRFWVMGTNKWWHLAFVKSIAPLTVNSSDVLSSFILSIVLYLTIYIELLTTWAFHSIDEHCVGVNMSIFNTWYKTTYLALLVIERDVLICCVFTDSVFM